MRQGNQGLDRQATLNPMLIGIPLRGETVPAEEKPAALTQFEGGFESDDC